MQDQGSDEECSDETSSSEAGEEEDGEFTANEEDGENALKITSIKRSKNFTEHEWVFSSSLFVFKCQHFALLPLCLQPRMKRTQ